MNPPPTLNDKDLLKMQWLYLLPVMIFTGTGILYSLGNKDSILQIICVLILAVTGGFSIINTNKMEESIRRKCMLENIAFEFVICIIAFMLSQIAGNIISSILSLAIAGFYCKYTAKKLCESLLK